MSEKNELVKMSKTQEDPYHATAEDFKVTKVEASTGQSTDGPGKNKLVPMSENQEGPREAEGKGGEGDSMSTKAEKVAAFKVGMNQGEGEDSPDSMMVAESIDLMTGKITSKGYKSTTVGEVHDKHVKLG
jgi:hypothetical protein